LRVEGGVQWGGERLYADNRFAQEDARARFAATPHAPPAEEADERFPVVLTTGRVAEQWHTMTRTGKSAELNAAGGPFVELSTEDAARAGIGAGDATRVVSRRGAVTLPARIVASLPPGVAFAPFHWGALHAAPGAGAVNATTN